MTTSIFPISLFIFALALLAAVVLALIAAVAGNIFHAWGTNSTLEYLAEIFRRGFAGSLRRRLMRKVNAQSLVTVDGSRQTFPYLAVMVASDDTDALTGPGGSLLELECAAGKGYTRHATAEGWARAKPTRVVVVADESLRRGSIRVRPVGHEEYMALRGETTPDGRDLSVTEVLASPAEGDGHVATRLLADDYVVTSYVSDPAAAMTMATPSAHIVLTGDRGTEHAINTSSALVGRGRECGVRFDSPDVSREHADVYFQEGTWWLRDRGSRNGTTVDGREVKGAGPVRLVSGNRIVLGGKAGEALTVANLGEIQ